MIGPTPVDEAKMPTRFGPVSRDMKNARIATASRILEGVAAEVGVPYLDLYSPLAEDAEFRKSMLAGDGVHPTADGYAIMAARIGAWSGWRRWLDKK
jgi:lysophospholipase L1-like esterase